MEDITNMNQEPAVEEIKPINEYATIFNIGTVALEVDGSDPDFIETLQKAWAEIQNFTAPEGLSDAERARAYIDRMDQLFDEVFGEGIAKEAFGTRSLMKRLNAWDGLFDLIKKQEAAMQERSAQFNSKYSAANRAARRAAEKNRRSKIIGS